MTKQLPFTIRAILSIAMPLCLLLCTNGCIQEPHQEVKYAPGMQFAAHKGKEGAVFIRTQIHPEAITDTTSQGVKTGSGAIISSDGYIVTNYHVVSHAQSVNVSLHDYYYPREHVPDHVPAEVIGTDSTYDLALIQIDAQNLSFLEFGNSDSIRLGESVLAIGNPYRLHHTVTSGIVSAVSRDLDVPGNATRNFIQTDVPINTGNSGGPLVNAQGELIGIMAILVTVSGAYEGYSFAMPSNLVQKIVNDLKVHGKRQKGSIGMVIRRVTREIADYARMPHVTGVIVDATTDGGSADVAGVKPLDIILEINGTPIESMAEMVSMLPLFSPGDTVRLLINRDGEEMEFDVVMQERAE